MTSNTFNRRQAKRCWSRRLVLGSVGAVFAGGLLMVGILHSAEANNAVMRRMESVSTFAFGGVGFAGTISPGEIDYRSILARPSAKADFESLLATGNAQAQCYALVGLRKLDPGRFKTLSGHLEKSSAVVETMTGCIMKRQTMAALIAKIEAGAYPGTN